MSQAAVNPADLAAAQEAESQTRTRAFWLSVGPGAPAHRHTATERGHHAAQPPGTER